MFYGICINVTSSKGTYLLPCFLSYLLTSFLNYFLPYFLPSLLPSFLPYLLTSLLPSLLPYFLPYLLPYFLPYLLTSFLPSLLTYLFTYSTVQSPSWAANRFAASQEIPCISRNPKVHYRTHKRPPPVSILGQPNPVHIPTSHLLDIHPNIIHPSTPRSPQWSPSLRFPHQDPTPHSPHSYAPHAQPVSYWWT
jgi:hypothetical protein